MPHPVDVHVGQRVRQRRWMLGLTQQQLAVRIGIRFQQVQKYETGENRMSASRLYDIAQALRVPVIFFYEGLEGTVAGGDDAAAAGDVLADREAIDLVRAFYAMPQEQRRHLYDLARTLGTSTG